MILRSGRIQLRLDGIKLCTSLPLVKLYGNTTFSTTTTRWLWYERNQVIYIDLLWNMSIFGCYCYNKNMLLGNTTWFLHAQNGQEVMKWVVLTHPVDVMDFILKQKTAHNGPYHTTNRQVSTWLHGFAARTTMRASNLCGNIMFSATSNKKIVVGAEPSHFHQPVILYKYVGSRFFVVIIINNEIK